MTQSPPRENKMGTMPVPKLLITMSLPMMISMLVQALYNIVDSIFVAQISENALTAVSLAFPVQSLMIAVSAGTCVGMNALLSRSLGEKNQEMADKTAMNGAFLAVMGFLAFFLVGLFLAKPYFYSQTAGNTEIAELGTQYLQIVTMCSAGIFLEMCFERIMQSTGRTMLSMFTQLTGAIFNIIFDPILIFGLFGFPQLGIRGAAIATVLGQCIAAVFAILLNQRKNPDVHLTLSGFRPDGHVIKNIYYVGVPSIVMQSIVSVMTFGLNRILITFSETAVSVLGVYFKLQSFVFMPVFGLNNGFIPIVAYNYGARNKKRIMETIRSGVTIAVIIMLTGLVIFHVFTRELLLLFNASEHMLEIGIPALRIISLSFVFAGYCIILGSAFQALGNGVYSLINSVCRQLLCILPLAWLFSRLWGLHALWYSWLVAELISVTMSTFLFRKIYKEKLENL
ncbi:MAG: MATE family efflux transporter [Clostridium sp.]|nr:MATE family efflux transporter [Clostridium sp.]